MAILRFKEMYVATVHTLQQELEASVNRDTSHQAHQLLPSITQSMFIISLLSLDKVFYLTLPLCKALQSINCGIAAALEHSSNGLVIFEDFIQKCDSQFAEVFSNKSKPAEEISVSITEQRNISWMRHRENAPG